MRYFSKSEVVSAVSGGRTVEQFLPPLEHSGYRVLQWICIERTVQGNYSVSRFSVFDEGSLDNLDVYSFNFTDPDNPVEEIAGLPSGDVAIDAAASNFGARADRYVAQGVIQDIYEQYLRERATNEPKNSD